MLEEGNVATGDAITLVAADPAAVSVADLIHALHSPAPDHARIERALACLALHPSDRARLEKRRA